MNALAHMTIGLGAQLDNERLRLNDYVDRRMAMFIRTSPDPVIILRR